MKVLIADKSIIAIEGLKAIINKYPQFCIEGSVLESTDLEKALKKDSSDKVIIFDPVFLGLKPEMIQIWMQAFPKVKWLAISQSIYPMEIKKYLNAGVLGFLLKECDEQEIVESIEAVHNKSQYLCGQLADKLVHISEEHSGSTARKISCGGIEITSREIEIIKLITQGNSNKEIADQLFLSLHTVNTHRKNIMNKLGINNTAGLVMFAIKNEILNPNHFLFS